MRLLQRARRGEHGVVAVELAIVIPIIAALVFGMVELGVTLVRQEKYVNAARDGARYAALDCRPDHASCQNSYIAARVATALCGSGATAASCFPAPSTQPAADIDCTATDANGNPINIGKPVTVSWIQKMVIDTPFFKITRMPTIRASFNCE